MHISVRAMEQDKYQATPNALLSLWRWFTWMTLICPTWLSTLLWPLQNWLGICSNPQMCGEDWPLQQERPWSQRSAMLISWRICIPRGEHQWQILLISWPPYVCSHKVRARHSHLILQFRSRIARRHQYPLSPRILLHWCWGYGLVPCLAEQSICWKCVERDTFGQINCMRGLYPILKPGQVSLFNYILECPGGFPRLYFTPMSYLKQHAQCISNVSLF